MNKKEDNRKMKKIFYYVLLLLLFTSGFLLGHFLNPSIQTEDSNTITQSRLKGYEYINP